MPNLAMAVCLAWTLAAAPLLAENGERRKVGQALLTFYWVADESEARYDGKRTASLRDLRGRVIARTDPKFRKSVVLEGTGRLRDGRTVVYHRQVRGEHRFRLVRSEYGITSGGCSPDPYRTAAVHPRFVRPGSTIYIPQLEGTTLPDGTIHDGLFHAHDRGKFRGAHVDVFVGLGRLAARPFIRKGYPSRSRVTVYVEQTRRLGCRR